MDRLSDQIYAESEMYPLQSVLADIGGIAGLLLGISVLGTLVQT